MNLPEHDHREPHTRPDLLPWLAAVVGVLAVTAVGGWWLYRQHVRSQQIARVRQNVAVAAAQLAHKVERAVAEAETAAQLAAADAARAASEQIVDDPDGKLLWASPTRGAPISLAYAPDGALCFVYVRPAQLLAHSEGEQVMTALGPWGREAAAALELLSGFKLADIDGVLATIVVRAGGELDACFRFELARMPSLNEQHLIQAGGGTERPLDLPGWPDRARFSVLRDDLGHSRTFVVCPQEFYFALAESDGSPPLVARDLEALVARSDRERMATVLVSPKFLAAGGAALVAGRAEPIRAAIEQLAGRDTTAIALSAHWADNFFVELRAAPALSTSPRWLAATMHSRLTTVGDELTHVVGGQSWSDYGRRIVERFPAMVRKLAEFTRYGEVDRQAVLRAYLPPSAGHNLVMGAELLLTQAGGAAGRVAVEPGDAELVDESATFDERLAAPVSLAFPRESLERALELWSAEAGVAAAIDGPAFQAAGITRNQALELDLRDRPAGEVLVEILRRANPDRTAASAADPRQSVVYVVEPAATADAAGGAVGGAAGSDAGQARIIVTTRAAAADRGRPLPAVFAVGGE